LITAEEEIVASMDTPTNASLSWQATTHDALIGIFVLEMTTETVAPVVDEIPWFTAMRGFFWGLLLALG
jgi:hypothetical protein